MYSFVDVKRFGPTDITVFYEVFLVKGIEGYECVYGRITNNFLKAQYTRVIFGDDHYESIKTLKERYKSMKDDNMIELIKNEQNDDYSDDSLFNISSWGADLSFREIIAMYEENELVKPELQRKYVWNKVEASRFVESILMGLPVPSVFFAQSGSQKLIVDGYQRIMTVYDYVRGVLRQMEKYSVCLILKKLIQDGEIRLFQSYP